MTVQELIAMLEDCEPDAEVRIAYQPSYPLESQIACVAADSDLQPDEDDEDNGEQETDGEVVWITEGTQIGYGRKSVWMGNATW